MRTKQIILAVAIILICHEAIFCQRIAWACKTIRVSSAYHQPNVDYGDLQKSQYSGNEALGVANVFPSYGLNPSAWTTKKKLAKEEIQIEFCDSVEARQIILMETLNPGNLIKVTGYDYANQHFNLFDGQGNKNPPLSRIQSIFIANKRLYLKGMTLIFDTRISGQTGIDAIGISDSNIPYHEGIILPDNINSSATVEKLSAMVNSDLRELNPVLSPKGDQLFFSRAFDQGTTEVKDVEDIWVSIKNNNTKEWNKALHFDSVINTRGPNFISSVHEKGDTLVFLMGNKYIGNKVTAGLTIFKYVNKSWIGPQNVNMDGFYNYSNQGNFFLTSDDKIILLSVTRDDTFGGRDLYVSKMEGKQWSEPQNLGKDINSAGDEVTPFMLQDNKTLFFSSNGHKGLGGTDIFISERLDSTWQHWTMPRNAGLKVNSKEDELSFTLHNDKAYFVRGTERNTDIYELNGPLFTRHNEDSLLVTIYTKDIHHQTINNCSIHISELADTETDSTGKVTLLMKINTNYTIRGEKNNFRNARVDTTFYKYGMASVILYLDIETKPTVDSMHFETIYFGFDSSTVKLKYNDQLNKVAEYLKTTMISIELSGHADAKGEDDYNDDLGKKRAQAVCAELLKRGVNQKQLTIFSFGEKKPTHPNQHPNGDDNHYGRMMNRRVELIIIAKK